MVHQSPLGSRTIGIVAWYDRQVHTISAILATPATLENFWLYAGLDRPRDDSPVRSVVHKGTRSVWAPSFEGLALVDCSISRCLWVLSVNPLRPGAELWQMRCLVSPISGSRVLVVSLSTPLLWEGPESCQYFFAGMHVYM